MCRSEYCFPSVDGSAHSESPLQLFYSPFSPVKKESWVCSPALGSTGLSCLTATEPAAGPFIAVSPGQQLFLSFFPFDPPPHPLPFLSPFLSNVPSSSLSLALDFVDSFDARLS